MTTMTCAPDAELSQARKAHAKAVDAELRKWARLLVGRVRCDCCKRTAGAIGEPCRRPFKYHYRRLQHCYDTLPGYRNMIDEFASVRVFDEAATPPKDMTAQ